MNLLRVLVNGWLGVIVLDAGVRLAAGLLHAALGVNPLGFAIAPLELLAVGGAIAAWCAAALSPRIPRRVILPPLVALAWLAAGALPVSVLLFNRPSLQFVVAATLLASVVASELLARTAGHGRWGLRPEPLGQTLDFRVLPALTWVGGWALLGPAALAAYLVLGASWAVSWGTAGFIALTPRGIAVTHKVYTLDDDTVDLIAMIHVGEDDAYTALFRAIPRDGTLVLAEGVHDAAGLLTAPRDAYERAAATVGLKVQAPIDQLAPLEIRNADVDVSTFAPQTIELLNVALNIYGHPDDLEPAIADYLAFWSRHRADAPAVVDQLFADILHARNAHLLAELRRARADHDRLVVPWGALHMVGIEASLREEGWRLAHAERVTLIRWSTLLGR